jgi:hypothetical protein
MIKNMKIVIMAMEVKLFQNKNTLLSYSIKTQCSIVIQYFLFLQIYSLKKKSYFQFKFKS